MGKLCFYHNDLDGECSAAILNQTLDIKCIPINYNKEFPFEIINDNDEVWIVDYSLSKEEDWEKLLNITKNIIWIDHHKSAIERAEKYGLSNLKGIRDVSMSGCALTWKFCYIDIDSPEVVKLVEDYDIWKFKFGNKTKNFHQGLISTIDTSPESNFWSNTLYSNDFNKHRVPFAKGIIYDICSIGEKILIKNSIANKLSLQSWGFEAIFEGYKCVVINKMHGSQMFESVAKDYDILISFMFDGEQYSVSLYHASKDIDLSKIAMKYGGGGHPGASGFQCKELPFEFVKKLD